MKDIYFITGTVDETDINGSGGMVKLIITMASALSLNSNLSLHIYSSFSGDRKPHYEVDEKVTLMYAQKTFQHRTDSHRVTKGFFWGFVFLKYLLHFIPKLISHHSIVIVTCTPAATLVFSLLRYVFDFKLLVWENATFDTYKGIAGKIRTMLFPRADLVISSTEHDFDIYQQMGFRTILIRNPCIIENTDVKPSDIKDSCFVILAAGRLAPNKGFDILLDIAACMKKDSNDWKIIIIGSGPDEKLLKDKMSLLGLGGLVEFYPFTRDLKHYYDMASIFALPSRSEGSPLVLIEAQALGIPCVAFDCPTGPREIISQGKSGFLIEVGDVDGFAKAIMKLLHDPCLRQQMSENAVMESEKFSLDFIVDQWLTLLNSEK